MNLKNYLPGIDRLKDKMEESMKDFEDLKNDVNSLHGKVERFKKKIKYNDKVVNIPR